MLVFSCLIYFNLYLYFIHLLSIFIHVSANGKFSLFFSGWVIFYCVYKDFFIYSSVNGYLGCSMSCKESTLPFNGGVRIAFDFFFGHAHGMWKFLDQGLNPYHFDLCVTAVAKLIPLDHKGTLKDCILKSQV